MLEEGGLKGVLYARPDFWLETKGFSRDNTRFAYIKNDKMNIREYITQRKPLFTQRMPGKCKEHGKTK